MINSGWRPKPGDRIFRPRRIKRFRLRRVLGVAAIFSAGYGNVGSLLAFMFAHASILSLRIRKPELPRPFKLGWNIRISGRELPISAIIGLVATTTIWVIIMATQPYSRWVGLIWMAIGLIIYFLYRRREHLPFTHTPENPEQFEQNKAQKMY